MAAEAELESEPIDFEDYPEAKEWMEMASTPPPWWTAVLTTLGWGLLTLVLAVTIFAQWCLWLILGMELLGIPGLVLGGLIWAVQIWLIFGTANLKQSCDLP